MDKKRAEENAVSKAEAEECGSLAGETTTTETTEAALATSTVTKVYVPVNELMKTRTAVEEEIKRKYYTQKKSGELIPPRGAELTMCLNEIFKKDPFFSSLRLNMLTGRVETVEFLPWIPENTCKAAGLEENYVINFNTEEIAAIKLYLAQAYNLNIASETAFEQLMLNASMRVFNPFEEYLKQLPEWDRVPRVRTFFKDFLGAKDTASCALEQATEYYFKCVIRRAIVPGSPIQEIPVLSGAQGAGKSTALKLLVGEAYYTNSVTLTMETKEFAEIIRGKLIAEFSEMTDRKKASVEHQKALLERNSDTFRAAYARNSQDLKRSACFYATTNDECFLSDVTGNRRFIPVICQVTKKDTDARIFKGIPAIRDQFWAELYYYYLNEDWSHLMLDSKVQDELDSLRAGAMDVDNSFASAFRAYAKLNVPAEFFNAERQVKRRYVREHIFGNDAFILDHMSNSTEVSLATKELEQAGNKSPLHAQQQEFSAKAIAYELGLIKLEGSAKDREEWRKIKNEVIRAMLKVGFKKVEGKRMKRVPGFNHLLDNEQVYIFETVCA